MKIRCHRGGYDESMETVEEIFTKPDLIAFLDKYYSELLPERFSVKDEYACYDIRNGWDTYYIIGNILDDGGNAIIALADGSIKDLQ